MSLPFLGEIRLFAGNFPPAGWELCNGQLRTIEQPASSDGLFLLLGTSYGGDGLNTYGLPDLRGRVPLHFGAGPGLSDYPMAQAGGTEAVQLNPTHLPPHSHRLQGQNGSGNSNDPTGRVLARPAPSGGLYKPGGTDTMLSGYAGFAGSGGSDTHDNHQPFMAMNYIIAVAGIFPSQG